MLVCRRAGHLSLVTQPEHAALAGRLGAWWGNARFLGPAAREALLVAADHHDDGWLELDDQPAHNQRERRPAHFTELPLSRTVGPYSRGVDSVYERDPLAGALVGMHFSGFYTGRWGLGQGHRLEDPIAAQVVSAQEARWPVAVREAWGFRGPRADFEADVWHAYEVLQALDLLSLALCLWDPSAGETPPPAGQTPPPARDSPPLAGESSPSVEPVAVESTLPTIEQPPGPRLVRAVPLALGERIDLELRAAGPPGVISVSPWPFGGERVQTGVTLRLLEDRPYPTAAESAAAFHAAPERERQLVLVPAAAS